MSAKEITIPVRLDGKTFKKFSRFDMFRLRRRWVRPVVFALILLAFAAAALLSRKPQAGLIAAVLLVVGMGLPLVYFGTFFAQVNLQAVQRGLDSPKRVDTVRLDFDGVHVTNDQKKESPLSVAWKDVQAVFHVRGCVYLYVSPVQAFLLPDGQANVPDAEVWEYLKEHIGGKCRF